MPFELPTEPTENDTINITEEIERKREQLMDCNITILPVTVFTTQVIFDINQEWAQCEFFAKEDKEIYSHYAADIVSYTYNPEEFITIWTSNHYTLEYVKSDKASDDLRSIKGACYYDAYQILTKHEPGEFDTHLRQAFIDYWTSAGYEVY